MHATGGSPYCWRKDEQSEPVAGWTAFQARRIKITARFVPAMVLGAVTHGKALPCGGQKIVRR